MDETRLLEEKRRLLTRTVPFILAGLALFLIYLHFFVGFSNIIETFSKVNLGIFLIAVLMTLIDVSLFTFTWYYLLKAVSIEITFFKALAYILTGIFVDILIPAEAVSAEISKIYLMNKDGVDVGKVAATLVTQRIYGMVITASSMLFACLVLLLTSYPLPGMVVNLVLFASGLTLIFLVLILFFCVKKELTEKVVRKILGFLKRILPKRLNIQSLEEITENALNTFFPSLSFLAKTPKKLLVSIVSAVSSWIFCLLTSQFVFYSLGYYQISFSVVVVVYSISMIVQSIPAGIPAEVGITEIVMSWLYVLFGVAPPFAATATILIRFLTVWLKFIMGFVALQWIGIRVIVNKQKQIKQN